VQKEREGANSLYKCTVRGYHVLHKWDTGGVPFQTIELQEMGEVYRLLGEKYIGSLEKSISRVYHLLGETVPRENMLGVANGHVDKH